MLYVNYIIKLEEKKCALDTLINFLKRGQAGSNGIHSLIFFLGEKKAFACCVHFLGDGIRSEVDFFL